MLLFLIASNRFRAINSFARGFRGHRVTCLSPRAVTGGEIVHVSGKLATILPPLIYSVQFLSFCDGY